MEKTTPHPENGDTYVTDNSTFLYASVCSLKLAGYLLRLVCAGREAARPTGPGLRLPQQPAQALTMPQQAARWAVWAVALTLMDGQVQRAVVLSLGLLLRPTRESFKSPNIQTTQSESPGWDPRVTLSCRPHTGPRRKS